jgi:hypothetical protein
MTWRPAEAGSKNRVTSSSKKTADGGDVGLEAAGFPPNGARLTQSPEQAQPA